MRRLRIVLVAALVTVGCRDRARARPAPRDAGPVAAAIAAPPAGLGVVTGTVWIAEERDHVVQPVRLDPRKGAWVAHGGGSLHLFPTDVRRKGDLVVIATQGETEADHVEQLAVVRGGAVAAFGPRAQAVRNPTASADGATVVVEVAVDGRRELVRIDADGRQTPLTSNPEGNLEPALSPDGTTLAFTSSRDGQAEVYRMPAAGGDATRLTSFHKDDWSPRWSADGARLAFLSDREGLQRLYTMASDGSGQARVTDDQDPATTEDQPRFAPRGGALAFLRGRAARPVLALADGGAVRTLTPDGMADTDLAWSPDATMLVVVRRPVQAAGLGPAAVVFVRVSDGSVVATAPAASPLAVRWLP